MASKLEDAHFLVIGDMLFPFYKINYLSEHLNAKSAAYTYTFSFLLTICGSFGLYDYCYKN